MVSRKNMLALLGVGVSAFVLSATLANAADTHEQRLAKAASAKAAGSSESADVTMERARREAAEKMVAQMQADNQSNDAKLAELQQQLAATTASAKENAEKSSKGFFGNRADVKKAEAEAKKYQEQITALNAQIAQMQADRTATDAKLNELQTKIVSMNDSSAKVAELQQQLAKTVAANATGNWEAQQQADIERARRQAAERAMAELQATTKQQISTAVRAATPAPAANDPQAAVEKARRQATEAELQRAKSMAGAADSENIRLAKENAAMQQQMAQLKTLASNDKMTQAAGQLAALEQRNSELMAQLSATRNQSAAAATAGVMTTNNDAATNMRIAELGKKAAQDKAEYQALLEAEQLRRQKLEAMLAQGGAGDASARMNEMAAQVADLTQKNAMLEKRVTAEGGSVPSGMPANTQVAELQKQLSTMKSDNAMLAEKLAAQSANKASAADNAQLAQLQKQLSIVKSDNEMLASKLAQAGKTMPVPVSARATPTVYSGDDAMAQALAETKSSLASAMAERDEYRNLLQRERQEAKAGGKGEEAENIRITKLESERADLVRKLEFEKSKNEAAGIPSGGEPTGVVKDLQDRLAKVEDERRDLQKQLKVTQADVTAARTQSLPEVSSSVPSADVQTLVAENKRLQAELASGKPAKADTGAMQSEIASLRAQNSVLNQEVSKRLSAAPDRAAMNNFAAEANYKVAQAQTAVAADVQKAQSRFNQAEAENIRLARELAAARSQAAAAQAPVMPAPVAAAPLMVQAVVQPSQISRPEYAPRAMMPASQPVMPMVATAMQQPQQQMPVTPTQVSYVPQPATANIGPSGSDISGYLRRAGIPMVSGFEKVNKVSGPQFGAFRWDTGTVFGTAEQEIMPNEAAFQQGVNAYLTKTKQRCTGTFDQSFDAGQFAQHKDFAVADVACVMPDGTGAGAAMVFYYKDGMFNVVAHEGDITQFDQAMSTRDSFAKFMAGVI